VWLTATAAAAQHPDVKKVLEKAVWTFSDDEGKTFALKSLEARPGQQTKVFARSEFDVEDPAAVGGVWVIPGEVLKQPTFTLNGKQVAGSLPEMLYRVMAIDPAKYLVKGNNVLLAVGTVANSGKDPVSVQIKPRLEIYPPHLVGIQTGPALGALGPDFFTVTCRTNIPATVTVAAKVLEPAGGEETSATSKRGYYHRLRVAVAKGTRKLSYTATSQCGEAKKVDGPLTVTMPDFDGGKLRFVAAGDSRSHPDRWAAVSAAIRKAAPELLIFSGDMVTNGRWDYQWDQEFFAPGRELLSTVPVYPAIGNHDANAPAYFELFYTPGEDGRRKHWSQAVGTVLLIGIDGAEDWSPASANAAWLEKVLAGSKEKFIFLVTHYPAFSSGRHGRYGERPMIQMRATVMPLLAKYKATALICGHDHDYERSEPPPDKGVTCIVSGGAGAPLGRKSGRASAGNPYSKVFASTLHYCLFEVNGDTCEMKALGLDGKPIDQKTFPARGE